MNVSDEPISTENSVKKWEMFINKWKSVSNVEFFRSKSCAIKTVLACKLLAIWTYTYCRLEEFVTLARGIPPIHFSARPVKQAWSRDGNISVLLVLIKGYYYVLSPLGGNTVRLCFSNGDVFLSRKRPFKLLINHVIWDTGAWACEPTPHSYKQ